MSSVGFDVPAERQAHLVGEVVAAAVVGHVEAVLDVGGVAVGEGAEDSVPNRQHVPVVAVRPGHLKVVVKLVHVGRDKHPTDRPVHALRQLHVGVREVGEKDGQDAVKQVECQGRTRHEDGRQGEAFAHHEVQGMVPRAGGHVHVRVAVVDHVQAPQGLDVVQAPVNTVLGDEVKDDNGHHQFHPGRGREEVEQPDLVGRRPSEHPHRSRPKCRVDGHGCGQKREVGAGVLPGPVAALEHGADALHKEVDRHACDNPHQLLPRRHHFKKIEERFHVRQDTRTPALWANLRGWTGN